MLYLNWHQKTKLMVASLLSLLFIASAYAEVAPNQNVIINTNNLPNGFKVNPALNKANVIAPQDVPDVNDDAGEIKTIEVSEPVEAYDGKKFSLYFQDIDLRTLLQIIAKKSGYNFVVSDVVQGTITLNLKDVTWRQALNTILNMKGLVYKKTGNLIFISTAEEMNSNLTKKIQSQEMLNNVSPLVSEVITLQYTDAESMSNILKGQQGQSLMSTRGKLAIDPRTNSIIVVDSEHNIDMLKKTIHTLDVPSKQVLIEARIVTVTSSFQEELGVRFGLTHPKRLTGTLQGANDILTSGSLTAIDGSERLNFNVPASKLADGSPAASIGLALARLGPILLDLELSALESEGDINILAKPRVVTSNLQKAIIETGQEIPYQEATSSGATSISFKKAVLSLEVIPLITKNNKITLKLKATEDTQGPQLTVAAGNVSTSSSGSTTSTAIPTTFGPPTINTQSVESYIQLNNNETFVVGGILQLSKTKTLDRVPFFSSIPVVGALFRHKGSKDTRSELLIFITPRIIEAKRHVPFKDDREG